LATSGCLAKRNLRWALDLKGMGDSLLLASEVLAPST
jgi:hypothetical protein